MNENQANWEFDVTVVMCTYNRCAMLPAAIESVLAQDTGDVRYEFIVVDNNSPDKTREVVESFIKRGHQNLRYVFEDKQGLSHARNAGIALARAPVIAFTDDDVRVAKDWVVQIKRALDEHPEVDYVGGKVLPMWGGGVPAWLTEAHWSPLALVEYGDQPIYFNAAFPRCLVGANVAFRHTVFEEIGLFTPDFQRVKEHIGSTEDHEHQLRIWRAGKQGLYVPGIMVSAEVQAERLTKAYHRRWHTGHGHYCAMMRTEETTMPDGTLGDERPGAAKLFGVAGYTYRDVIGSGARWAAALLRRQESTALWHENRVRHLTSYIRQRYGETVTRQRHSPVAEVVTFTKAILHRKVRGS